MSGYSELFQRARAVLIGCAWGDAMGMPTEFLKREDIRTYFPNGVDTFYPSTPIHMNGQKLQAGEITDDTINTLLIVEMLKQQKGKVTAQGYLDHLVKWMNQDPEKNAAISGPSTKKALNYLAKGKPLERAGILGTTNGSSMRISPIGILFDYRDLDHLIDQVEQICIPTHNNSIAIAGASAVAACVSYGVRGGDQLEELWALAFKAIEKGSQRGFHSPSISLKRRLRSIYEFTVNHSEDEVIDEIQNFYGCSYETSETIPAVFAIIQLAGGNPLKAARICAEIGGDTDTYGAIATAICGAMHPDFPCEQVSLLESVNHLNFSSLTEDLMPYIQIIE